MLVELEKLKCRRNINKLVAIGIAAIVIAFSILIANIVLDDEIINKNLWLSINVISSVSFIIVSIIIGQILYNEVIRLRIISKAQSIKDEPIYIKENVNLDNIKSKIINTSIKENNLYVIKDRAFLKGNTSYYFYFPKNSDVNGDMIVNEYRNLRLNEASILVIILDSFNLNNDQVETINEYNKKSFMKEYLNNKIIPHNIIILSYNENKLSYYKPKVKYSFSLYSKVLKIVDNLS